jgi:hypothetical protein
MKLYLCSLLIVLLACAGCGSKPENEKPSGAIPEPHLKAMEKAQGLEGLLDESYEKRKQAADQ